MISFSNICFDDRQLCLISTSPTKVTKNTKLVECHERESNLACNQLFLLSFCATYRGSRYLRGSDCKYRESLDKLKKSKILITCQKNTFGELSSKMLLKPSGILLFSRNSEKRFCLIYYAIIRLKIKQIETACFKTVCNARKQF